MNGTADPLLPYGGGAMGRGGGERGSVRSTDASIEAWRRLGGFDAPGGTRSLPDRDTMDDSRVTVTQYPATGPARLMLYRIDGGGHSEPSRTERYARWYQRLTGPQNGDMESAEEIWRFFAQQRATP